jgi:hypothetical protein
LSHSPQRKEKDCLNCGTIVQGHYCQHCGQENIEPKETFWHMVTHFFYDITHFDGSFFVTLKDLLFKPGFLSKEYMKGRRKTYLHPVRMYVFTSAVFFLVFYSLFSAKEIDGGASDKQGLTDAILKAKKEALSKAKTKEDTVNVNEAFALLGLNDQPKTKATDTIASKTKDNNGQGINFNFENSVEDYKSVEEYDSIQKSLPEQKKDNWFVNMLIRRAIAINVKYDGDQSKIGMKIWDKFMHSFPYLLFVSLPLYALFLKLLYIRRKHFFYADHGVFLIHLYVFTFIALLLYFFIDKMEDITEWRWLGIIQAILLVTGMVYTVRAIKYYYEQRWGKTILKFIIFNILCLVAVLILFTGFLFLSFYQV